MSEERAILAGESFWGGIRGCENLAELAALAAKQRAEEALRDRPQRRSRPHANQKLKFTPVRVWQRRAGSK